MRDEPLRIGMTPIGRGTSSTASRTISSWSKGRPTTSATGRGGVGERLPLVQEGPRQLAGQPVARRLGSCGLRVGQTMGTWFRCGTRVARR